MNANATPAESGSNGSQKGSSKLKKAGGSLWSLTVIIGTFGWVVLPISALLLGAGLGRTVFPEMHTRVFEWVQMAAPLIDTRWGTAFQYYPSFNRLPLGGGWGMGIMVVVCAIWFVQVYRETQEDQVRAKVLKSLTNMCIVMAVAMGAIFAWKCALGTLSWWAIPPMAAALASVFVVHNAENTILHNRDIGRGREGTT